MPKTQNIVNAHLRDAKEALAVRDLESAEWSCWTAMQEAEELNNTDRQKVSVRARTLLSAINHRRDK